jgi:hypothetical protein
LVPNSITVISPNNYYTELLINAEFCIRAYYRQIAEKSEADTELKPIAFHILQLIPLAGYNQGKNLKRFNLGD